jgi:hypothetical protein
MSEPKSDKQRRPALGTECVDHPRGPVDRAAPEGWGRCFFCNMRRLREEKEQSR